jgi:hypothetical protein
MPSKLAIIVLAAALAVSIIPVHAAGMPEIGTKNFIPGGDTPSYLTNENLTVAPGEPDNAFDPTVSPAHSVAAPTHSAQTRTWRGHGKFAAGRKTTNRAAAGVRIRSRPTHAAGTAASAARAGATRHNKASARHAAVKSAARRG